MKPIFGICGQGFDFLRSDMLGEGITERDWQRQRGISRQLPSKDRLTTVEYPEERLPRWRPSRNFPFLVYDGADCSRLALRRLPICEKECPPKCIYH